MCLQLDRTKEYNDLDVNTFTITYDYDFSKIDYSTLKPDSRIEYVDTIEYKIEAKNKDLPKEFAIHLGNEYSIDEKIKIMQKHGSQNKYEVVPPPLYKGEVYVRSGVRKYSWQIQQKYITNSKAFPLYFKLQCNESTRANSSDIIDVYPKQYAKKIDTLIFKVNINCNKKVLSDVKVFKIWKDKKTFKHTPISGVEINGNTAEIKIEPDCNKLEAYYLKLYWNLVE